MKQECSLVTGDASDGAAWHISRRITVDALSGKHTNRLITSTLGLPRDGARWIVPFPGFDLAWRPSPGSAGRCLPGCVDGGAAGVSACSSLRFSAVQRQTA